MKKSKYSDSQIMLIIKQSTVGVPVPEICREHDKSKCKSFIFFMYKYNKKTHFLREPVYTRRSKI